jgi:hypothetical protein
MRRTVLLVLVGATAGGCDDVLWGPVTEAPLSQDGYVGVQAIADTYCISCHSADAALGQLDLETDLHNATVGVGSSQLATFVLVQPGDPANSLLYLKITNQAPAEAGTDMPPGSGGLDPDAAKIVEDWIAAGAPDQ